LGLLRCVRQIFGKKLNEFKNVGTVEFMQYSAVMDHPIATVPTPRWKPFIRTFLEFWGLEFGGGVVGGAIFGTCVFPLGGTMLGPIFGGMYGLLAGALVAVVVGMFASRQVVKPAEVRMVAVLGNLAVLVVFLVVAGLLMKTYVIPVALFTVAATPAVLIGAAWGAGVVVRRQAKRTGAEAPVGGPTWWAFFVATLTPLPVWIVVLSAAGLS
jgi:hypothetical protein